MKMKKVRTIISYVFIISAVLIYVFSNGYTYKLQVEQNNFKEDIQTLATDVNKLEMEINIKNPREQIVAENGSLKIYNNIYYLENDGK